MCERVRIAPTVLFDFFGTLVDYSPSRTEQGYERSSAILRDAGCPLAVDDWLARWDSTCTALDAEADRTGIEFAMPAAFAAFVQDPELGLDTRDADLAAAFLAAYLEEWGTGVWPIDGVPELLAGLHAAGHRVVLVTNTHDAAMVRGHLATLGISNAFDAIVTSVEVGFRKPRPEIYDTALAAVGARPSDAVFVGDTLVPDYLGPRAAGIDSYLIVPASNPSGVDDVPHEHRIRSVFEIERVLSSRLG